MVYSLAPVSNLYWLNDIRPEHHASVGYKAFYLSQLLQTGYPVIPGFVVSASVLRSFLETLDWTNPLFADLPESSLHLDVDNAQLLQAIAHQFRQAIEAAHLPDDFLQELGSAAAQLPSSAWILRPSLFIEPAAKEAEDFLSIGDITFKGSGLFNSRICQADGVSLTKALKQVWSDFLSAKSLFYWQRTKIQPHRVNLAVLIQPLQSVLASGTLQTRDDHIEVCATFGLGMAIAWGEVTPDTYIMDAQTGTMQSQQLGQKNIAYGLSFPSGSTESESRFLNVGQDDDNTENPLKSYLLTDQQQAAFALAEADLHQLVHLHQRITAEMKTRIELEWVLLNQDSTTPQLCLTQLIPQISAPIQALRSAVVLPLEPSTQGKTDALELFPGSMLIATGLPASPGQVLAKASVIAPSDELPVSLLPHTVVVAAEIPLDWMPFIQTAAALVVEQGGMTSHCAIVARELNIPAVVGVSGITQQIRTGESLWVDGDRGKIYRLAQTSKSTSEPLSRKGLVSPKPSNQRPTPSPKPLRTHLMVNTNQPNQLQSVAKLPVKGVGLLRAELLALSILDSQHPLLWFQQKGADDFVQRMSKAIQAFAETFKPYPVFYRAFDLRSHEFYGLPGGRSTPIGANPMLGLRGTFSYLLDPTLFNLELQALANVQQSGYDNVNLMLPFVRTVEEFKSCRQLVEQAGLMNHQNFQLWIMAEVPSVLLLLPDYVEAGVQGISIGTNDLTQLLLGVDRDYAQLATVFDERHPAVKRAIAQLIRESHQLGIPCSICGEAPVRHPELIDDLVRWGITSISVAPSAVTSTYAAIAQAERNLPAQLTRSTNLD